MKDNISKEKVLKRVRAAVNQVISPNPYHDVDFEKPIYASTDDPMEVMFAEAFTAVGGKFVYCIDYPEFIENLQLLFGHNHWGPPMCKDETIKEILSAAQITFLDDDKSLLNVKAGITGCEFLVARHGSIAVSSMQQSGRKMFVYPEIHIVVAYTSQIVMDIKEALAGIRQKYEPRLPSQISLITGPSRTADIEKTLVMGAHGPKEIYLFLIDDLNEDIE